MDRGACTLRVEFMQSVTCVAPACRFLKTQATPSQHPYSILSTHSIINERFEEEVIKILQALYYST